MQQVESIHQKPSRPQAITHSKVKGFGNCVEEPNRGSAAKVEAIHQKPPGPQVVTHSIEKERFRERERERERERREREKD